VHFSSNFWSKSWSNWATPQHVALERDVAPLLTTRAHRPPYHRLGVRVARRPRSCAFPRHHAHRGYPRSPDHHMELPCSSSATHRDTHWSVRALPYRARRSRSWTPCAHREAAVPLKGSVLYRGGTDLAAHRHPSWTAPGELLSPSRPRPSSTRASP
jgi:hypothetical protein